MRRGYVAAISLVLGFVTMAAEALLNYDPKRYWPPFIVIGSAGLIWDAVGYFYVDRRQKTKIKDSRITGVTAGIRTPDGVQIFVSAYAIPPAANNFIDATGPSPDPRPVFLVVFAVWALVVVITWLVAEGLLLQNR